MNQIELFGIVIDVLNHLSIPYMIVGSIASTTYGKPRLTDDMDIVVDMRKDQIPNFASSFDKSWFVDGEMIQKAVDERFHFNLLHIPTGIKIDFFLVKEAPYDQEQFARRRREKFTEKRDAFFASVEDVIIRKLDYYFEGKSEKHLDDIRGILAAYEGEIDLSYITRWATERGTFQIWRELKQQGS